PPSLEVTLKTEVESGASGFSVTGGGYEGIFVKQVLKGSPASKLFCLREGDQLLSATIFFDNIKYEDALKILQYSEPYKVQFSLKRKLTGKEELEKTHPTAQQKKEKLSQKGDKEKGSKFKMPKFGIPSFGWYSTKETSGGVEEVEASLKEPHVTMPSARAEGDLTVSGPEIQVPSIELEIGTAAGKRGEKGKIKMPDVKLPSVKLPKVQAPQVQVSLPKAEGDISLPKAAISGKGSSGDGVGMGIKIPKDKISSLEISTSDIKIPQVDVDVSLPKVDVTFPKYDVTFSRADMKQKSTRADVSLSAPGVNIAASEGSIELKSPDTGAEGQSDGVSVDGVDVKIEGLEGKIKMPKFQKPKFGISVPKGKVPESEVSLPKMETDFPQLKTMTDIADIVVEAPTVEVESGISNAERELTGWKIKMPKISEADSKAPKVDINLPSVHVSMPIAETGIQSSSAVKVEEELKLGDTDEEQKSQIKKSQFIMPKISFSKIKSPKSQVNLPKVEGVITVPKTERDGEDLVQIPDIERSHTKNIEEGAQISIKMPKVKIPTLEFSKPEMPVPKAGMDISLPDVESTRRTCDMRFQQADLKSGSAGDDVILSTGIEIPTGDASIQLKSPETRVEGPMAVNEVEVKVEGLEGKIKMPKFQKPKFGTSLPKGKRPESEISFLKMEAGAPHLTMTTETVDIAVESPVLEVKSVASDVGIEVSAGKMKMPQVSITDSKASEMDVSLPSVSVSSEEHQSWFKMPKFRMSMFGRSSSKEKRGDTAGDESLEKPQVKGLSAEIQTVIDAPEYAMSLPDVDTEADAGKDALKGKMKSAKTEIPKEGLSLHKGKSSDVTLSKFEVDVSLPPESAVIKMSIPETETYADVVKRGVEGQKLQTHIPKVVMPKVEPSASEISASKTSMDTSLPRVDITLPKCDLTLQEQKGKPECTEIPIAERSIELKSPEIGGQTSTVEIALAGTQKKLDVLLPKVELDIQHTDSGVKTEKLGGVIKSIGKDVQGTESKLKMPKFSVPSFGGLATNGTGDVADFKINLEEPKLGASGIKMDAEISVVEHEIEFQIESAEKDISAGVGMKVEDGDEARKMTTSKFKMPKFGVLPSKAKGSEVDVFLPKLGSDVSLPKTEQGIVEIHFKKADGSIDLKSPHSDLMESSIRISMDKPEKHSESKEVNIKIPKLKIPAFTYKAPTLETDVSTSKVAADMKAVGTDNGAPKLDASTSIHKEKPETAGDDRQMPRDKIPALAESDIKTLKVDITIPSTDSSISKTALQTQGPLAEGKEIKMRGEAESGYVDIERKETYSFQIVKESEIPSSEIKTATFGFSLLKVKIPESHVKLDIPVKLQSYTEYKNEVSEGEVHQPKLSDESLGLAMRKTDTAEFKFSGKPRHETDEFDEVVSSRVSLPKLKTLTVEVQPSSKLGDNQLDKQSEVIVSPPSTDCEIAKMPEDEKDMKDQKEKPDSNRPSGRFKFWLPSIGFSSSVDDTGSDSKAEVQKSVPEETQPVDSSAPDIDSSKQTEKTGWFRFPKLGFSSPSKKAKNVDKEEETNLKETKTSDEESPSEKYETFFDAEESLSPKETMKDEENETRESTSNVQVSGAIVTSSARTELILLERERASQQNIPEDTTK
uniref:PDZ domain-containing protein n=1 Tax=Pelusios castaneus TaxID=367368 RepID=A0A8C8VE16_9SAUR